MTSVARGAGGRTRTGGDETSVGMIGSTTRLVIGAIATTVTVALIALSGGAMTAQASASCGIYTAAGHGWIVVVKGVTCPSAKAVVRGLAARTAAVRAGGSVTVASPLAGFTCVLASRGKPGGSCSTPGATRSILWIVGA